MKKTRPQLTVLATDHKATSDEEDDELEASCQIGETTLRKANLRINRSGVRFVSDSSDFKLRQQEDEDVSAFTSAKSIRNLVTLDELETCGLVGRGSSGQVFKARHRDSHTLLYAVKVVTNVFDKPRRDQLLTEIRTLYDIESPYLVGFYGAFFHDHALSLVLEFCALGSLDQVLRTLPDAVPERIVASIAVQVLTGLQHLKRTHHFHRDVKPQNILMQQDGAVKLTDFGLARELGSTISMAQTFVGTFKYMAPERVQNERYECVPSLCY
ncbi:hypothetical protein BBJ28_00014327 [Nothophytophthora sp. Chile5]|nr:hypothetical protein BBJ28_00014327 [Nothophytophthora sp. Chile5]